VEAAGGGRHNWWRSQIEGKEGNAGASPRSPGEPVAWHRDGDPGTGEVFQA